MRILPLLGLAVLGAACSPPPSGNPADTAPPGDSAVRPFADEADYRSQRTEAASALEAAIGDAVASSADACRVVATSEQACGGPASFAVYSAETAEADAAERLAARLVALDVQANGQFEFVSTCVAYEPPRPALVGGRCVAEGQ